MGLIDKAAVEADITLERDVPVVGQRRCRDWAKLIGIARKLESTDSEAIESERNHSRESEREVLRLQRINYDLLTKLQRFELKERMEKMEIPVEDRQRLLGSPMNEEAVAS